MAVSAVVSGGAFRADALLRDLLYSCGERNPVLPRETYILHKDQVVFLNSHEPHSYTSDAQEPLGTSWIEFLGSDSRRIMERLIERYSPLPWGRFFRKYPRKSDFCSRI